MDGIKGRSDLILAAAIAALLHGTLFIFFPGVFTPSRLALKECRPLRISFQTPVSPSPQRLAAPLAAPSTSRPVDPVPEASPVPRKETKKVAKKKTDPVRKEVGTMEPRHLPEAVPHEEREMPPLREAVAAVSREAVPPEEIPSSEASELSGLSRQEARYRHNPPPSYPSLARRRGYEGTVLLMVEVLPEGSADRIRIRKSSGFPILDQAAIDAVGEWQFEPARENGTPRTSWVEIPVRFMIGSP